MLNLLHVNQKLKKKNNPHCSHKYIHKYYIYHFFLNKSSLESHFELVERKKNSNRPTLLLNMDRTLVFSFFFAHSTQNVILI